MQAIVGACRSGRVPGEVVLVVSNKPSAPGLAWAMDNGLETSVFSHRDYASRQEHDAAVVAALQRAGAEWVCLAGYMRLLSPLFLERYPQRVLNIHPSLLPAFPGLDAQRQAWEYGVKISGCTVHLVDLELDHGPIVVQRQVRVEADDTPDSLAQRILVQEHEASPEALHLLLTKRWRVEGRRVVFGSKSHHNRN